MDNAALHTSREVGQTQVSGANAEMETTMQDCTPKLTQKRARRVGRPSKLEPNVQKILENAIAKGASIQAACSMAGIAKSTYFNWMAQAREDREAGRQSEYSEFLDQVDTSRAEQILRLHRKIYNAGMNGSWRAAAWMLAMINPERYGSPRQFRRSVCRRAD